MASPPAQTPAPTTEGSLRGRIKTAALWAGLAVFASQFLRFGSNLLLTRFLAPEMFGIMAIVAMFQYVLLMITDVGFRDAALRSDEKEFEALYNTTWSLQVLRGVLICLAGLLIAGLLALAGWLQLLPANSTYASPYLPPILAVSSFAAVLIGLQSNQGWRLERRLNTRRVVVIDLWSQLLSTICMCVLAWATNSIWSLAFGGLLSAGLTCLFSHVFLPGKGPRFEIDKAVSAKLFNFGIWILVSSLCSALSANIDKMMFGWLLTPALLGYFTIAQNLVNAGEMVVMRIFAAVGTAALSEVARKDREGLRRKFYSLRLPFDIVMMMAAGGLYACGSTLAALIFDSRYGPVGPILQILSILLIAARYNSFFSLFLALGLTRNLVWMAVVRLATGIILIPLCFHAFGFEGAVLAGALVGLVQLPVIAVLCRGQNLVDLRFELLAFLAWLPGYGLGLLFVRLFG